MESGPTSREVGIEPASAPEPSNVMGARGPVYLDYAAGAPIESLVLEAVIQAERSLVGNPHNRAHSHGRSAHRAIERARRQVATCLGATSPDSIVFTSGATESNNLAILGTADRVNEDLPFEPDPRWAATSHRPHAISCTTEHASVLGPLRVLRDRGTWDVTLLPVDAEGRVDPMALRSAMTSETRLVSIMAVNNETGVVQPIPELGAVVAQSDARFHCDATQAIGRIPVDVEAWGVDLLSLSGHKLGGPKGTGALFVRNPGRLKPRLYGGAQERELRPGTVNTAGIVGLGVACEYAAASLVQSADALSFLTGYARQRLLETVPNTLIFSPSGAAPGILTVAFEGVDTESLLECVEGVSFSAGSACHAMRQEASHVLVAMGLPDELLLSTVRLSFGPRTTRPELDAGIEEIARAVAALRSLIPVGSDPPRSAATTSTLPSRGADL